MKEGEEIHRIRFRQAKQFFNIITENLGKYKQLDENSKDVYREVIISNTITEYNFYRCFLYLKTGLAKTAYSNDDIDSSLTAVNIDYMAAIMCKPVTYTMPAKSKNSVQRALAEELGRTPKSAYSAINRLKKAAYLTITEDSLIVPNQELQTLRMVTKKHLNSLGVFPISYLLNFIITDGGIPGQEQGEKGVTDKG